MLAGLRERMTWTSLCHVSGRDSEIAITELFVTFEAQKPRKPQKPWKPRKAVVLHPSQHERGLLELEKICFGSLHART